jgi:hypothetical protein
MVNLLNPNLRIRDIRKLVEPNLIEITWDEGVDDTSEWILASFEDPEHIQRLNFWLNSKAISGAFELIIIHNSWSNLEYVTWEKLLDNIQSYFNQERTLIIASDRTWVMEYNPQQIARFGRWM